MITLPRQGSFDQVDAGMFAGSQVDYKSALTGEDAPHGYFVIAQAYNEVTILVV
jgi:hypothetical protein